MVSRLDGESLPDGRDEFVTAVQAPWRPSDVGSDARLLLGVVDQVQLAGRSTLGGQECRRFGPVLRSVVHDVDEHLPHRHAVVDVADEAVRDRRQPGVDGRPFTIWKFRTMVRDAEAMLGDLVPFDKLEEPVFKLRRDPRVTRVGRVIRRFSLDELPQIVNVLCGDMSIVGPRPEQADLVERYKPEQCVRLTVKPGLTGPMQVYGRGRLDFEERLAVEREYVENLSLGRDARLLALSVAAVVRGTGAY
jgi:lipopolysaccharide/colanic/teichoic acid biosynthesis glycosyltransferase